MDRPLEACRQAGRAASAWIRGNNPLAHPLTYTGEPAPERFNLARYCLAGKPADKTALIVAGLGSQSWTYGALEDIVLRMARGLRDEGVEEGQRLLIRMGNSLDYALVFFAANAMGAIPIPASPLLTASEIDRLMADSEASYLAWDGMLDLPDREGYVLLGPVRLAALKRAPRGSYAHSAGNDPAYLVYTSGSGGKPKGVLHAQRAVWGRKPMYEGWLGIGSDDVMLHTQGFNWTYTLGAGLFDPFANGATAIVYTGPRDVAVWQGLIEAHGATILASVPGVYRQLLRTEFKPARSLRHGLTAGEALAVSILGSWRERTGTELYEALGMSEISTYVSSSPQVPVRPGSPGKPQRGRAVRILDDGQIAVHRSDPGLFLRYWGEQSREDEWFATGDLGEIDGDGYLWYKGRIDDLMNAGGFRVSPAEVERALAACPLVAEIGVREWRVSETVSIVAAFVVPRDGENVTETALNSFARERLADYKCPKQYWLVTHLPRSANGKLDRKALTPP